MTGGDHTVEIGEVAGGGLGSDDVAPDAAGLDGGAATGNSVGLLPGAGGGAWVEAAGVVVRRVSPPTQAEPMTTRTKTTPETTARWRCR